MPHLMYLTYFGLSETKYINKKRISNFLKQLWLILEGHSTIYFSLKIQNVYSEVASKKPKKDTARK